jgi:hypothetical protein
MELHEFIEASKRYHKRLIISAFASLGMLFLGVAIQSWLQPITLRHLPPTLGKEEARFISTTPLVFFAIISLFGLLVSLAYGVRKTGLLCPLCNKALGHPPMRYIVIASKCCPHCGQRIIEEDAPGA